MASEGLNKAIQEFKELTDFNVNLFLVNSSDFFEKDHPNIINWYKGVTDEPNSQSFKNLFTMLIESSKCLSTFSEIKSNFDLKFYHFELLEELENIHTQLTKCLWLSKLLRSTRTQNSWKSKIELDYVMKKYDTLEKVQRKQINFVNFDNDWWELALRNDLSEKDYDVSGGKILKLPVNFKAGQFLKSVVDNPIGEKMYGREINRKLTFIDDDLDTLSYNDTVKQSLEVFLETRLGSIPEFPKIGYNESLITGSNRGTISLPILQRQLLNIFRTDDSFTSYKITRIEWIQDSFFLDFEINTVRGESLSKTIKF